MFSSRCIAGCKSYREQVLQRARQKNLKLNKDKSQTALNEISYFRHVLSKGGLKPDPKKVQAITEMKKPQNKEELQELLGMVTYVAKFLHLSDRRMSNGIGLKVER